MEEKEEEEPPERSLEVPKKRRQLKLDRLKPVTHRLKPD
jgi:hypothetical protein